MLIFAKSASALCLALCALANPLLTARAAKASILWHTNSSEQSVELKLDSDSFATLPNLKNQKLTLDDWHRLFDVTVDQENISGHVATYPLAGDYKLRDTSVIFRPVFPFEPGIRYRANFRPAPSGTANIILPLTSIFTLPATPKEPTTFVTQVYPTADILPQNLLKFYLHFSAPMSRGHIYAYIHLLNETGRQVELPFLEIDEELWSPDMTRLTLFLDPGRIKRGVRPLEEVGPALLPNQSYTLVIDSNWCDATGTPLKSSFEKQFRVTPPDREAPDPKTWRIEAPPAGTRRPLQVIFSKPMDHALALRMITITRSGEKNIDGESSLTEHETRWSLTPAENWAAGSYQLNIRSTIEDLAGNNIGRPFEIDLAENPEPRPLPEAVSCKFEIR
ncbi:MAG TPA: Ig-like domain-containing protein [Verrucomicrobiae bacterium]|jgi:hypothetical protein|nr:Ig-like domain-containing protein [Verrucomicrobiae bacterium]